MNPSQKRPLHKECFVTIGATAGFEDLLLAAISNEVSEILTQLSFTDLTVQCGTMNDYFSKIKPTDNKGLRINNFGFKAQGLENEMKRCQPRKGVSEEGLVICHAGAGTILDAMRLDLPLVVVPNSSLLDNHQDELADELERQGYVVKSSTSDLANAIRKATANPRTSWMKSKPNNQGIAPIVDEVLGYKEEDTKFRLD